MSVLMHVIDWAANAPIPTPSPTSSPFQATVPGDSGVVTPMTASPPVWVPYVTLSAAILAAGALSLPRSFNASQARKPLPRRGNLLLLRERVPRLLRGLSMRGS